MTSEQLARRAWAGFYGHPAQEIGAEVLRLREGLADLIKHNEVITDDDLRALLDGSVKDWAPAEIRALQSAYELGRASDALEAGE